MVKPPRRCRNSGQAISVPTLGSIIFWALNYNALFTGNYPWLVAPIVASILLFLGLFLCLLRISRRATDSFSSLVVFGILGLLFTHVYENVGMTINLMPITGIPLPFFSYGGSFLLACWIAVGILVRISAEGRGRAGEMPMQFAR